MLHEAVRWSTVRRPDHAVTALAALAKIAAVIGDPGEAHRVLDEGMAMSKHSSYLWGIATFTYYRGVALLLEERLPEAIPQFQRALEQFTLLDATLACHPGRTLCRQGSGCKGHPGCLAGTAQPCPR